MRRIAFLMTLVALGPGAAKAEPASADPAYAEFRASARNIASFSFAGAELSVAARGRRARADTALAREALDEARAMGKFMPGYPQPALVVVDVRIWF